MKYRSRKGVDIKLTADTFISEVGKEGVGVVLVHMAQNERL
jgi:hypothetical protein